MVVVLNVLSATSELSDTPDLTVVTCAWYTAENTGIFDAVGYVTIVSPLGDALPHLISNPEGKYVNPGFAAASAAVNGVLTPA